MRAFNVAFLTINLLLLALLTFMYFETRSRDRERFDQLRPVLMKHYAEFGLKLPYENPRNLDELLAPLHEMVKGLNQ